ncbi:hypothetical protein RYA05_34725 [Pseudomonas syringae pv. actinidiae]|uniref:hypothetical protein n=1 Tax=Pseudomonas syringae TaxID=317 RepID=UPI000380B767|nr:hypothetical protein [Pseudomonas syringae]AKT33661.1 hypothetical protein IYO_029875 [Pseudomonas syringae pv. actinidiae ICMP 18884]AOE60218.1 hypothetical protein NZ708_29750 [Pseudomonas syringae pv. actinidiae ICMP 18708]APQ01184.1 hypothetical protein PsaNZ45_30300 [Pseudomonas syringae pv. actinidiae]APQ06917.1 hypothetical protein PsaNZ47_29705 [Pseudomonas syringae pv. actinidiae]AQX62600.1 hypothetical protein B1R35_31895 [Pseudomonas syringae pv. actinidiae]
MNGYEHPTRDTPAHAVYRLSWLAYANVIMTSIFLIAVSLGIGSWTTHNAQSDSAFKIGITFSVFVLVVSLAIGIYRILFLKSVRLYTDDIGVWIFRGILPWSKGVRGVKWRDIEDAMYYTGFFSWMFRSYTVRIGHRFTKTSEIFVYHLAQGHTAVEHINRMHQTILQAEQAVNPSREV